MNVTVDESESKYCIECASEISISAKKCYLCGEYQSNFKNATIYLTKIAGVATILSALFVFIFNSLPELKKNMIPRDDIEVISFITDSNLVLLNLGNNDIFAKFIETRLLHANGEYSSITIPVQKFVRAGSYLNHKFGISQNTKPNKDEDNWETVGTNEKMFTKRWVEIVNKAIIQRNKCYKISVRDIDDPQYLQIKSHYDKDSEVNLMTVNHNALLHYYSFGRKKSYMQKFDVIGIVYKRPTIKC